jgi:hypothetical protein
MMAKQGASSGHTSEIKLRRAVSQQASMIAISECDL